MKTIKQRALWRTCGAFFTVGFLLLQFPSASLTPTWSPEEQIRYGDMRTRKTLDELDHLGLRPHLKDYVLRELLYFQKKSGKSLAETLREPEWANKLGLSSGQYKVTWYIANPFELLPRGLQTEIKERNTPLRSRSQIMKWAKLSHFSESWRRALKAALIETTPENLWRASRGKRPFAKNGRFLEPIVVDHGNGKFEVRDGHIATDPRVIPTNTEVLLLVRINGEDRILKVRAADIGGGVRGKHVDLPIHVGPETKPMPDTRLPEEIRNRRVHILTPVRYRINRGQKA